MIIMGVNHVQLMADSTPEIASLRRPPEQFVRVTVRDNINVDLNQYLSLAAVKDVVRVDVVAVPLTGRNIPETADFSLRNTDY